MNIFERILYFFDSIIIETPLAYGWFHILSLVIILGTAITISIVFRNCSDKVFRRISLVFWIIIVVLEIGKQLLFAFNYNVDTGEVTFRYQWYAFPYQFCSSPLYVLPLVIFLKDGKVRDCAISFISLFSLFAGLSAMFYPGDIFTNQLYISVQTMVHHGTQAILGIFYLVYNRKKITPTYFLKAVVVFILMALIALLLNELVPLFTDDTFNMWFISRHFPNHLPILSIIYQKVPYVVFLLIYLLGFSLLAFVINMLVFGIIKASEKITKHF